MLRPQILRPEIVGTAYGRAATLALGRTIAQVQTTPLQPVTVIVPSNFAGLAARRMLGSGQIDAAGMPVGIANVNFVTPFRLAELLAAGQLGDRRPLTAPVLTAAVRRALRDDPRHFRNVRDHHATEQAVAVVAGELSNASGRALEAIESMGGYPEQVVGLYRSISSLLGGFHDEAAVARAAAFRPDLTTAVAPRGHLIWFLPGSTSAPLASFLRALFAVAPTTVIVGRSGDPAADADTLRACRIAGIDPATVPNGCENSGSENSGSENGGDQKRGMVAMPVADHVISVTDADEEVRAVIREVLQLAHDGVALDRIGIFHPTPDPYVRILEQHFAASGVPANGPSRQRLAESVAGRVTIAALALPAERWRRDRVMALVTSGPLRHDDKPVRPASWEKLSRSAGVVGGLTDWRSKLERYRTALLDDYESAQQAGSDQRAAYIERDFADANALSLFVDHLAQSLAAVEAAATWQTKSEATIALLHGLLGPAHTHRSWPDAEQASFEQVESALDRLAQLDDIDPGPSTAIFQRALAAELDVARGRTGRFGHGVVYGPLSTAAGHDLDAIFILGCAEGLCPVPRREDSLLPDAARRATNGDLPERLGQLDEQHRLFLAALAAAPQERRWLFLPRGDLRSNRQRRPSRWLLPSASHLAGRTIYATDFANDHPAGVHELASHARALLEASHHTSADERDLATVYRYVLASGDAAAHPAAAAEAAGINAQRDRASSNFTAFDGNLAGQQLPSTQQAPLSASRLENWSECGFRYFLAYVLSVRHQDDPERTVSLSMADRGTLLHEVLEKFLGEMIQAGPPDPATPWTREQRQRARSIAQDLFTEYEASGRTGRPVLWQTMRADLLDLLDDFLHADNRYRAGANATPTHLEFGFGMGQGHAPPLEVDIGDGHLLRFRGMIDRIDHTTDGRVLISDYKTGAGKAYRKIDQDPLQGGTTLQLGIYADAVKQHLNADQINTHYWMVNPAAGYARFGYLFSDHAQAELRRVLGVITTGIEQGVFVANPGAWQSHRSTYEQCQYCVFDSLCPADRAEHAVDKARAPEVQLRRRLTEPDDDPSCDERGAIDRAAP